MGRHARDTGGGDFQQPPRGTHLARCVKIIDIGTHHGEYQGKPTVRNQIIVQWELPAETVEIDGQQVPLVASKFYTNSLSEKANLRKDLERWRTRPFTQEELAGFDLMNILDKPCLIAIEHNEEGKAKVTSVSPLMKGQTCPPAHNKPEAFWIDEWDDNKFAALSEGFRKLIAQSDEYKAFAGGDSQKSHAEDTDDIPF